MYASHICLRPDLSSCSVLLGCHTLGIRYAVYRGVWAVFGYQIGVGLTQSVISLFTPLELPYQENKRCVFMSLLWRCCTAWTLSRKVDHVDQTGFCSQGNLRQYYWVRLSSRHHAPTNNNGPTGGTHLIYNARVCCPSGYKNCWSGTELL